MVVKTIRFFNDEIKSLELAPEINGCEMTKEWKEQIEICKTAKSALEKQIAKKPTYVDMRFRHHGRHIADGSSLAKCYKCPNCLSHIFHVFDSEKYCNQCGQALDWSDTE